MISRATAKAAVSGLSGPNSQSICTKAIDLYLFLQNKGESLMQDDTVRAFVSQMNTVFGDTIGQ